MMLNPKFIDEISVRLSELAAASPVRDFEKNARALLNGALARLELVGREEFEVQAELLARTRDKLETLEARIATLEAQFRQKPWQ